MNFFPQRPNNEPKIYGYTETSSEFNGLIKVGYTEREDLKKVERTIQGVKVPKELKELRFFLKNLSMRNDGTFLKIMKFIKCLLMQALKGLVEMNGSGAH